MSRQKPEHTDAEDINTSDTVSDANDQESGVSDDDYHRRQPIRRKSIARQRLKEWDEQQRKIK
jgi:hypothetical protein